MELNIWKKFIYISIIVFCKLFKDAFFVGINYRKSFQEIKFFSSETQQYFSKHLFIHKFICYFFTFSAFLIYILCSKELHFTLISKGYKSIFKVLFLVFLWLIEETINELYKGMVDLEFWMIGLMAISIMNKCIFKNEIKNHQICSNSLMLALSLLKIVLIIIDIKEENQKKSLINKDEIPLIVVLGILYIGLIALRAFAYIKIQNFMNNEGIFAEEILMIYGFLGAIFYSIIIIGSTFIKCEYFFRDYICAVPYNGGEDLIYKSQNRYLDNYQIYFDTFKGEINKSFSNIEILYEILVNLLGIIVYIPYKYFFIQVIGNLSPEHAIFSYSINKIIPKIILPFFTYIKEGSFSLDNSEEKIWLKFFIGLFINFFAIINFLIYLEIIVLNCCKLADDVSKNIDNRKNEDLIGIQLNSINNDEENELDNE